MAEIIANTDLLPFLAISWQTIFHTLWWVVVAVLLLYIGATFEKHPAIGILWGIIGVMVMHACYQPSEYELEMRKTVERLEEVDYRLREKQMSLKLREDQLKNNSSGKIEDWEIKGAIKDEKEKQQKVRDRKNEQEVEMAANWLEEFRANEGRQIQSAITDLELVEADYTKRLDRMRIFLEQNGLVPQEDENYTETYTKKREVEDSLDLLRESFNRAHYEYRMFKLTDTRQQTDNYKRAIATGTREAESTANYYADLIRELRGENKKD
ncbi:MAG: hypothetical protein QF685_12290 [Verrucomicrobiota bacterium]|jgi:hypothetical protein|nr:hypothetical protein [Verrucomicrobiota bacterium]